MRKTPLIPALLAVLLLLFLAVASGPTRSAPASPAAVQKYTVRVGPEGYTPSTLTLKAGVPAEITFLRNKPGGCVGQVVFPDLKLTRDLPLNTPVKVAFTPRKGTMTYTCGMGMMKGSIVAR